MSVTLTDLVTAVNAELENKIYSGSAEVVGDDETSSFSIAPTGYSVVNDNAFRVYLGDVLLASPANYTMDFVSGICDMDSTPTSSETLMWMFNYTVWPETLVKQAINAGIQALFPSIYVATVRTVATGAIPTEYELDDLVEFVTGADTLSGASWARKRRAPNYEVFRDGSHLTARFYSAPSGSVRFHTIERPTPLTADSDTLTTTSSIPERCLHPIVSYSCYYLLTQKVAPRTRSDASIAIQGQGNLSPRQMNDASNSFYLRYQMQLQSIKMPPWSSS